MAINRSLLTRWLPVMILGLVILVATQHRSEYARVTSPDGNHYAVADYSSLSALVPRGPGSGGDKPGRVTIYTSKGESCGSATIPMLSLFNELRWQGNIAEIRLAAEWDLAKRSVQEMDN